MDKTMVGEVLAMVVMGIFSVAVFGAGVYQYERGHTENAMGLMMMGGLVGAFFSPGVFIAAARRRKN